MSKADFSPASLEQVIGGHAVLSIEYTNYKIIAVAPGYSAKIVNHGKSAVTDQIYEKDDLYPHDEVSQRRISGKKLLQAVKRKR
jgi:hypothetical protein